MSVPQQVQIVQNGRIDVTHGGARDICLLQHGLDVGLHRLLLNCQFQFRANLFQARCRLEPRFIEQDHVPAELGLDRIGIGTGLEGFDRGLKRGHHHAGAKPPQAAAIGTGGSGGFGPRQLGKVGAFEQALHQRLGFVFRFDENMRRVVFRAAAHALVTLLVGSKHRVFGQGGLGNGVHDFGRHQGTAFVIDAKDHPARFPRLCVLRHCFLTDHLLKQPFPQGVRGQLLVLVRQTRTHHQHVTKRNLGPVYRCNHRIRIKRILRGHWHCGCQGHCRSCKQHHCL